MSLPKMRLCPAQASYNLSMPQDEIVGTTAGGAPRTRLDMIGGWLTANISFIVSPEDYNYFWVFYRSAIKFGSMPFLIDLKTDRSECEEHTVRFVPNSVVPISSVNGRVITITAQIYVKPIPHDSAFDEAWLAWDEAFGDVFKYDFDLLERLVNLTMPDNIGVHDE